MKNKISLAFIFLLMGSFFMLPQVLFAWYDNQWSFRVPIEINPDYVAADVTDYPVYVDLNDLPAGFHTNVTSDGGDIRVTTSDGETEVARELVFYTAASDTGELHFLAPSISGTATTTFYVYYGNSSADDYAVTDTYGRNAVWANYAAVWHTQEDPSGSAPQIKDSKTNTSDLTSAGSMTSGDLIAGKLAGNALDFDTNDYLVNTTSTGLDSWTDVTVTLWVNSTTDHTVNGQRIFEKGANTEYALFWNAADTVTGSVKNTAGSFVTSSSALNDGAWYHIAFTIDNTSGNLFDTNMIVNASSNDLNTGITITSITKTGDICVERYCGTGFHGADDVDEIRVYPAVLSGDRITTEYNNQNSPGTFYWLGAQQSAIPTTNLTGHWNASDASHLFQNYQAGTPYYNTAVTTTADPVDVVLNEQGTADRRLIGGGGTTRGLWDDDGINGIGSINFDGTNDLITSWNDAGSAEVLASTFFSVSAFTAFASIRITGDCSNSANMYDNDAVWSDGGGLSGGYIGLHCKTSAGVTTLYAYNFDTTSDSVGIAVSQNTDYVVMVRHEGGNLYLSVNDGSESSVASGNTGSLGESLTLGRNYATAYMPVRIGEVAFYSTALTGTDFDDAMDYFMDKWQPAVVDAPTVSTSAASSITSSTATLNGSISATGGADATQHGFAYGTGSTLVSVIATSTLGAYSGTGSFNTGVTSLSPSTTYYFRAYATNSGGTGYGSILSFTTSAAGSTRIIRLKGGTRLRGGIRLR